MVATRWANTGFMIWWPLLVSDAYSITSNTLKPSIFWYSMIFVTSSARHGLRRVILASTREDWWIEAKADLMIREEYSFHSKASLTYHEWNRGIRIVDLGANRSEGEEDSIRFIMPVGCNVQREFSCVQKHDYTLRKCHQISANLGKLTWSELNLRNLRFPRIEDGLGRFLTLAKWGWIVPVLHSWELNNPKICFPPIRSHVCVCWGRRRQKFFHWHV